MTELSKSTENSVLIWLTFTARSRRCGRKVITHRLVEWDPESKRLLYVFPIDGKRGLPDGELLNGRPYKRPHEFEPNIVNDPAFAKACQESGVYPPGAKVS